MMAEPGCCQGCVPANRLHVIEIFADRPLKLGNGPVRVTGTWQVLSDPDGWRYQLHGAALKAGVTRRALMAAGPLFCLPVPALAQTADGMAVDIHSHAGKPDPDEFLARSVRAGCRADAPGWGLDDLSWPSWPIHRSSRLAVAPAAEPRSSPGPSSRIQQPLLRAARLGAGPGAADHQDFAELSAAAGQPASTANRDDR